MNWIRQNITFPSQQRTPHKPAPLADIRVASLQGARSSHTGALIPATWWPLLLQAVTHAPGCKHKKQSVLPIASPKYRPTFFFLI